MAIIGNLLFVIVAFYFFNICSSFLFLSSEKNRNHVPPIKKNQKMVAFYVIVGHLLRQGISSKTCSIFVSFFLKRLYVNIAGARLDRKLAVRLSTGTFLIGMFILTSYYINLMTSFMTAPNPQPLIKSVNDLANRSDLHLVTDKNLNMPGILVNFVKVIISIYTRYNAIDFKSVWQYRNIKATGRNINGKSPIAMLSYSAVRG